MSIYYNSLFLGFALLILMMTIDKNVVDYFLKLVELLYIKVVRYIWWIWNDPDLRAKTFLRHLIFLKYYLISFKLKKQLKDKMKDEL